MSDRPVSREELAFSDRCNIENMERLLQPLASFLLGAKFETRLVVRVPENLDVNWGHPVVRFSITRGVNGKQAVGVYDLELFRLKSLPASLYSDMAMRIFSSWARGLAELMLTETMSNDDSHE